MDKNARTEAADDAPEITGGTAMGSTEDDVHHTRQTVVAMLMGTYEQLDRLERLLSGASTCSAQPGPPTRAALVAALQVIDIINGNLHGRDFAEFAVLERVLGVTVQPVC